MTFTKTKFIATAVLTLISASLAACGTPMQAIRPMAAPVPAIRTLDGQSAAEKTFRDELSKRGIQLTDTQIGQIRSERRTKPNGLFAPRPAENLTAEQNLKVHFEKHRSEFPGVSTPEGYLQAALSFVSGQHGEVRYFFDTTSFEKGYQTHVVRWQPQTKEFSAVRSDGALTTYYKNFRVAPNRFIQLGEL